MLSVPGEDPCGSQNLRASAPSLAPILSHKRPVRPVHPNGWRPFLEEVVTIEDTKVLRVVIFVPVEKDERPVEPSQRWNLPLNVRTTLQGAAGGP